MSQTISKGDFEEYEAGTQVLVRVRSGEIKLGDHPNTAQRQIASYVPDNGWISWTPSDAEQLVVYAVEDSEVDVQYNDGFSISLFGLPVLDVDSGSPNTPDYRNQTVRIPAEGVVEANADQTQNVTPGSPVTSTVQADTSEVWQVTDFGFKLDFESADYNGEAADEASVTVRTEGQGIELAFVQIFGVDQSDSILRYGSGQWFLEGSGSINVSRDGLDSRTRVDDDSGLEVTVNSSPDSAAADNTITASREIRFGFEVVRA